MPTSKPILFPGQYILTNPLPARSRCKAYTAPPPCGRYICTIEPNTHIGPIERVIETEGFVTILCRSYWINIWKAQGGEVDKGFLFARVISREVSNNWCQLGWVHQP